MAISFAEHGIRVNAIAPGYVKTGLVDEARKELPEAELAEYVAEIEERTLLSRMGEPDELKALAVYFASPASSYVTGQTIAVDGGFLST